MKEFIKFVEDNFPKESLSKSFNIDYIRLNYFLNYLENKKVKDILEIGPGFGFLASYLAYKGYNVVVIEHPDTYINTDKNSLKELARKFQFEIIFHDIELDDISFSKSFDLCYSLAVIEYLHHSPKKMLSIIDSSLKDKGLIYLDTPNALNLRKRLYMFLGIYPYVPIDYLYNNEINRSHIREYSKKDLYYILDEYGFKQISIKYENCMNKTIRLKNDNYVRYSSWMDFFSLYGIYTIFTLIKNSLKDTLIATAIKN